MFRLLRTLSLCWMVIWGVDSLVFAQDCLGQVRINEIVADPASDWNSDGSVNFKSDEWVEVVNVGSTPVDLTPYRLTDASGVFRYGFSGVLGSGQTQVVLGSASVAWESAEGFSSVGLSLNNSGDTVQLLRIDVADTVLVDSFTYDNSSTVDDRSVGRMPDGIGPWFIFDGMNPFAGTVPANATGCPPTPGFGNGCPTAVEDKTWSGIKLLFS